MTPKPIVETTDGTGPADLAEKLEGLGASLDAPLLDLAEPWKRPASERSEPQGHLARAATFLLNEMEARAKEEPVHDFPMDDAGNAAALARYLRGFWIHTPGRGDMVFDPLTGAFSADVAGAAVLACASRLPRLRADLSEVPQDQWKARAAFASKSASERSIRAMMGLAARAREIYLLDAALDADPWTLNASGTAIDLRRGIESARPATPEDLFTRSASRVEEGPTPIFDAFLDQISCGREDWKAWILRFFGYALTGDTAAAFFPILWGRGRNGKGAFERLVKRTHGSYFGTLATSVVLASRNEGGPRPDLVDLDGLRCAGAPEVPPGRLNLEAVKALTGGDSISAARKFRDNVTFTPRAKIFMTSNAEPDLERVDEAIRRRIRKVPFDLILPADAVDPSIEDRLAEEAPRVLARFIQEAAAYHAAGCGPRAFPESPTIEASSSAYLAGEDLLGLWLSARTVPHGETRAAALYANYRGWCESEGLAPKSQTKFGKLLIAAGYRRGYDSHKVTTYSPISISGSEGPESSGGFNEFFNNSLAETSTRENKGKTFQPSGVSGELPLPSCKACILYPCADRKPDTTACSEWRAE